MNKKVIGAISVLVVAGLGYLGYEVSDESITSIINSILAVIGG